MNSSSSKLVWLVVDSLTFGGIETHLLEVAKGLVAHNISVKVWLTQRYTKHQALIDKLQEASISFGFFDGPSRHWLVNFHQQTKKHKPDVIHAHGYKASLAAKLIKMSTSTRQISTYHAGETPKGRVKLYDFLDRSTAVVSDASIAVSKKVKAKLYSNSVVLNNFIDTSECKASRGCQIAFVGRLSFEKAPDQFLELATLNPSLEFHLYGDGPMRNEIEPTAAHNTIFHGHQTDMDEVWSNIGILVISSRQEGLPMTAIEAMARGVIVISTDVGDVSKLIEHEHNGFIAHDAKQLNLALNSYLSLSSPQQEQIKRHAIETVSNHYSQVAVIPQLLRLYNI